ncbi:hypothetical protein ACFQZI_10375 [Mucilaginibacter lutimaris]|uniref:DUF4407 domain-containing protein n=1 Tax=Mucilaginibacter lutimaris TaxID=931629 RepID=A0ABW2ZGD7_9SPHI
MMKKHSTSRTIVSLIGIDYQILTRSGGDNMDKFFLCGLTVICIAIISFLSVFYAFDLMFHKWYAEVLLSGFFSLTFLTIYLLLIQTFSKERLPRGYKSSPLTTSNVTRTCFVIMISFLMAQPVRIYFLENRLDQDIERYRIGLFKQFVTRNKQLYQADLQRLKRRAIELSTLADDGAAVSLKAKNDAEITAILATISTDNEKALLKINNSDFFLQRIKAAGRYPVSWLICLLVMIFFGIPVVLILSISGEGRYYLLKKQADHELIESAYLGFKERYSAIFLGRYGKQVAFYEVHTDAPYNWNRIPEPGYGTHEDFQKEQGW